jgi:hypothetical protein
MKNRLFQPVEHPGRPQARGRPVLERPSQFKAGTALRQGESEGPVGFGSGGKDSGKNQNEMERPAAPRGKEGQSVPDAAGRGQAPAQEEGHIRPEPPRQREEGLPGSLVGGAARRQGPTGFEGRGGVPRPSTQTRADRNPFRERKGESRGCGERAVERPGRPEDEIGFVRWKGSFVRDQGRGRRWSGADPESIGEGDFLEESGKAVVPVR